MFYNFDIIVHKGGDIMKKGILSIILVSISLIFVLLISTLMVTNSKFIYNFSVDKFQLEVRGGIAKNDIESNYSYIVDYILGKEKSAEFKLPTLEYSEDGAVHFYEVRKLFDLAKISAVILFLALILSIGIYYINFRDLKLLKYTSLTLMFVPVFTALVASSNFNFFFTIFHKIFFNNNKWLFDPLTDPIINILPEEFFALCAALIVLITIVIGLILFIFYKILQSNKNNKRRNAYIDITSLN